MDRTPIDRAELLKHRAGLQEARLKVIADRDRLVVVVAGGALGISLTFIKDIAPNMTGASIGTLSVGWIALVAAILVNLWSLHSSENAHEGEIGYVDHLLQTGYYDPDWINPRATQTRHHNRWASGLLVVGVSLILVVALVGLIAARP